MSTTRLADICGVNRTTISLWLAGKRQPRVGTAERVMQSLGIVVIGPGGGPGVEIEDAARFYVNVFRNVVEIMATGAAVYCWHAHKRLLELMTAWRGLGLLDHQQVIWVKPAPVFGSVFWHFRHEPCLMGWLQGNRPPHDGRQDHNSVWTAHGATKPLEELDREELLELVKAMSDAWEMGWEGGKSRAVGNEHPTQKPVELFARPMRKHTRRGEICFEPFSGSGTQIIAAEQLGRRCYSIELQPVFVDVAIRRWQSLTGLVAKRESDGAEWKPRGNRHGKKRTASTPDCRGNGDGKSRPQKQGKKRAKARAGKSQASEHAA